ncbi:MAG: hypothetical protein CMK06_01445 [Ponticaulis sp.]|nr:hypothetical protein [Ponticaulis sp.]
MDRFFFNQRGNVAMIFALCLLPLIVMMGGAVDMSRQRSGESRAQEAIDAALLAVARNADGKTDAQLTKAARRWFETHMGDTVFDIDSFSVVRVGDGLRANVTGGVDTAFLGLIGIGELKVNRTAEIEIGLTKIELVMALDTTGSMAETPSGQSKTKLESLEDAALQMVTTLDDLSEDDSLIEIGVVPFATYVNVGSNNADASWMDTQAKSEIHGDNLVNGLNRFDLYEHLGYTWKGCVMARIAPHDVQDTKPTPSKPETLFVPLFHPDEPDKAGWREDYPNNYVDDVQSIGSTLLDVGNPVKYGLPWSVITLMDDLSETQKRLLLAAHEDDGDECGDEEDDNQGRGQECNKGKGKGGNPLNPNKWHTVELHDNYQYYSNMDTEIGPSFSCDMSPILPLTSNYLEVRKTIKALKASGSTNISEGVAWAWRALSPEAPFMEGDRFTRRVQKVMVLLSDGNNSIATRSGHFGGTDYSAYGYMENERLEGVDGWYDQKEILDAMDKRTKLVCQNAKQAGVRIFVIRLAQEDERSEKLLKGCASSKDDFIDVQESDDLDVAFREIADKISNLRISH